ncbi:MAG: hypothetical protein N2036_03345 [Bryobacteraceae bacterium]|nr:hypothetical protein [Bryobacteraceae bacterium]
MHDLSTAKLAVVFIAALTLFHLLATERLEGPGHDSSIYILGARSLAYEGKYEMGGVPITTHPPGLPLLLAPIVRLTGNASHEFLVRFMPLFGGLGLLAWLAVLRQLTTQRLAATAVILTVSSPAYFQQATRSVMADLPYLLPSGLAILSSLRLPEARVPWIWGLSTIMCTAFAVLTRTAGVSLAGALLIWAFWPKGWPGNTSDLRARIWAAAAGLVGLLVCGVWMAWVDDMQGREEMGGHMATYSSQFLLKNPLVPDLGPASPAGITSRVFSAAPLRSAQITEIYSRMPWVSPRWYNPLAFGLTVLLLAAMLRSLRDPRWLLVWLYFACFFGLFCLWPFAETARFMLPAAPAAFVLAWAGGAELVPRLWKHPRRVAAGLLVIGAVAGWMTFRSASPLGLQDRLSLVFWPAGAAICAALPSLARKWEADRFLRVLRSTLAPAILAGLTLAGLGLQAADAMRNLRPQPEAHPNGYLREVVDWLRREPPGTVMCSTFPYVHRMTGRRCVAFPVTGDPSRILQAIEKHQVRYLIVAEKTGEKSYFRPSEPERMTLLVRAYPSFLRLVHTGRGWKAYEVRPRGAEKGAGGTGP